MNPFDNDSYFEVKMPLTDEGIEILREVAPEALKDYDRDRNRENVDYSICEMIVAFVYDEYEDETENCVDLSDDVASYFKTQAILSVITQFSTMPETKSIINSFAVMRG